VMLQQSLLLPLHRCLRLGLGFSDGGSRERLRSRCCCCYLQMEWKDSDNLKANNK
jgi:hypothetical protein